jgi:hypothetical protein
MENRRKVTMVYNGTAGGTRTRNRLRLRQMDLDTFGIRNWRERAGNREDGKRATKKVIAQVRLSHQISRRF